MSYCPSVRSRWLDIGQQVFLFSLVLNNGLDFVFALYKIYYRAETKLFLRDKTGEKDPPGFLAARGPRVVNQMAGFANFGHSCN